MISDRNLETLVVVPSHPTSFCASLCLFWAFGALPESVSMLDRRVSSHRATDWATIRSRDFRMQGPHPTPPPPTLGCSLCQNVSHIKDKTMTLCNILWIWALISGSHTAWLCMTLSRWGKSLRGTRSQIVPWVYYPLSRDSVMPGKRAITGVKKKERQEIQYMWLFKCSCPHIYCMCACTAHCGLQLNFCLILEEYSGDWQKFFSAKPSPFPPFHATGLIK